MVISYPEWILGTQLEFPGRVASVPNSGATYTERIISLIVQWEYLYGLNHSKHIYLYV